MVTKVQYDQEGMARMISMEFRRRKEERTKRKYHPNPRHDTWNNWMAAADCCIRLNADPIRFVEACFLHCRQLGGPFANQLGGPGAENWWRASYQKTSEVQQVEDDGSENGTRVFDLIKYEVRHSAKMLIRMTGSTEPADWWELLASPYTPIPPYIKLAFGHWMPGVKEEHAERGLKILARSPEVHTALKTLGFDLTELINEYRK